MKEDEPKYFITLEQFEQIRHYKRMFELNADLIKQLCENEKDDIVYGFELGQMHSHLRACFSEMFQIENEIINQGVDKLTKIGNG